MRQKNIREITLLLAALLGIASLPIQAGGRLETIDITGLPASPFPGFVLARVIGIRWDPRCIPVQYRMNDLDPIPNPLGPAFLSMADAQMTLDRSMQRWNDVPTSFAHSLFVGGVNNPAAPTFDMINEQSFISPAGGFIAASPSTSLIADSFLEDGDDLDGDGDSDVSNTITTCMDVDSDGDIEFPEGQYAAGTILDNDVFYNASFFRFTVTDGEIDINSASVDLEAVAVHELGHSHGLSHVISNQKNGTDKEKEADGTGPSMFPFIDTNDPDSELSQRSLDSDDIAWVSLLYPEGTAGAGPAALQPGDVPFGAVYGLIEGEIFHGGQGGAPLSGASVSAMEKKSGVEATAFSGTTQVLFRLATGQIFVFGGSILDGRYTLPARKGNYDIAIEAVDGSPVPSSSISLTAQIGSILGQQNFTEEFYNDKSEAAVEEDPGEAKKVKVKEGESTSGIHLTTNVVNVLANFGSQDFIGLTGLPANSYYAVAFPAAQITGLDAGGGLAIQSGLFFNNVLDDSRVVQWGEASLNACSINPDGTANIDLKKSLEREKVFIGQDNDFAPFFFKNPTSLGKKVLKEIGKGSIQHLCLVLQVPDTVPGPSGFPPLIGLDGGVAMNDAPILGLSFASVDGNTWLPSASFNFLFALQITPLAP